jgi:cation diffusion facilitator CzcD-associated flavoprotein CzcO
VLDRIRTGIEVKSASWDEGRGRWRLETSGGPQEAEVLLTACGQLSVPKVPPVPGLKSFEGPAFHTAEWRHDVELAGRRVAVIGTGCSAIQVVPAIQPEVAHLDVYQRSPGWTLPKMDYAYPEWAHSLFKHVPAVRRLDLRCKRVMLTDDWYPALAQSNVDVVTEWPWTWSNYRRRTAQLEPGAYALSA